MGEQTSRHSGTAQRHPESRDGFILSRCLRGKNPDVMSAKAWIHPFLESNRLDSGFRRNDFVGMDTALAALMLHDGLDRAPLRHAVRRP
jgi:hypothetical protein